MVGTVWDKLDEFFVILKLGSECVCVCVNVSWLGLEFVVTGMCLLSRRSALSSSWVVNADVAVTECVCLLVVSTAGARAGAAPFRTPISLQLSLAFLSLSRRHPRPITARSPPSPFARPPPTSTVAARTRAYSSDVELRLVFSSRGLASPKIDAFCAVSASVFSGASTDRGFSTSRGRSWSSTARTNR